jgi:hypothetical protein
MSDEKELLILISRKLDTISKSVQELNERVDRLEGKTDDIHHYVPFVGWLEEVGRDVSRRFSWLKGHREPPKLLLGCESDDEDEDSDNEDVNRRLTFKLN